MSERTVNLILTLSLTVAAFRYRYDGYGTCIMDLRTNPPLVCTDFDCVLVSSSC